MDFSPRGIDLERFPYATWRKISRSVLKEEDRELFLKGEPQGDLILREAIRDYLHAARGVNCDASQIIIGAGNLGQALANYVKFEKNGFLVKGLFDVNPKLKGVAVRGIVIRMTDELPAFLQEHDIQIAALTLPKQYAKEMADFLVDHGIRAIWNFAHTDLHLPEDVIIENVHLSESLMQLSYNISRYSREHK